jgi:hypothetical protein
VPSIGEAVHHVRVERRVQRDIASAISCCRQVIKSLSELSKEEEAM